MDLNQDHRSVRRVAVLKLLPQSWIGDPLFREFRTNVTAFLDIWDLVKKHLLDSFVHENNFGMETTTQERLHLCLRSITFFPILTEWTLSKLI